MNEDLSKINEEGTAVRAIQLRLLTILMEFDKICRKHNIQYWLAAGTLLGAVRHNGFIPWDDDIDLSVEYKDLKKLRRVLNKELPSQFVLQDYSADKNYYLKSILKIRDKKSFAPYDFYKSFKEQGLFIDIIPVEKIPSMKFKRFVFNFNKQPYLRHKELSLKGKSNNIKGLLLAPFSSMLLNFAHWYSKNSTTKTYGYNYLFWLDHYFKVEYDENVLFPLKEIEFEGMKCFVPNDSVKYLTIRYGDFMRIPPVENRQVHSNNIEVYD